MLLGELESAEEALVKAKKDYDISLEELRDPAFIEAEGIEFMMSIKEKCKAVHTQADK